MLTTAHNTCFSSGTGHNVSKPPVVVSNLTAPTRFVLLTGLLVSMKFFAKAPHVQRTLRAELLSVLDDSPDERHLRFTDVSSPEKTPYLEAVLYEVLRVGRVGAATSKASKHRLRFSVAFRLTSPSSPFSNRAGVYIGPSHPCGNEPHLPQRGRLRSRYRGEPTQPASVGRRSVGVVFEERNWWKGIMDRSTRLRP